MDEDCLEDRPSTGSQSDLRTAELVDDDTADRIINGVEGAIAAKTVTYDFERLMPDATLLTCSEFGNAVIEHMGA